MDIIFHSANNLPVGQRQVDGYINATAMCQAHKKKVNDWLRLESTLELTVALAEDLKTESFLDKKQEIFNCGESRLSDIVSFSDFSDLIIVKRGSPSTGGGTWLHPDLAIQLAQWCSPKFALQVSRWIKEWLISAQNPVHDIDSQPQTPPSPPQPQALPGNFMTADLTPEDKHYQQLKAIACDELKWKYRYRG